MRKRNSVSTLTPPASRETGSDESRKAKKEKKMKAYKDFDKALEDFRRFGGAMNFCDGTWYVGSYEAVDEMINDDCTVRYATELALAMGGMSEAAIQRELDGWTD